MFDVWCLSRSCFDSIAFVIGAINKCRELASKFLSDHSKQRNISDGFHCKSSTSGISCCVECSDSIVIWTHKPTKEDNAASGVDKSKPACGRKHKFGLNLQAVCNHRE
jgi:hypothetical protein